MHEKGAKSTRVWANFLVPLACLHARTISVCRQANDYEFTTAHGVLTGSSKAVDEKMREAVRNITDYLAAQYG